MKPNNEQTPVDVIDLHLGMTGDISVDDGEGLYIYTFIDGKLTNIRVGLSRKT